MPKNSSKRNWNEYWERKQRVEDVYSNVDRIMTHLKKVTDLTGKKILEVGAGTARDSLPLLEAGADVYVLDYSPSAMKIISELKGNHRKQIKPILADAFKIPVQDGSFDVVFHQGLLEHFRDPLKLLRENVRVLKKDGYLLVDVPQKYHIYTIIKHILIFFNKWFAGWETEFTINELRKLTERTGVNVVYQYGSWKRPSLIYRMIREILLKVKIKLPLYPNGFRAIRNIRKAIREHFSESKWSFYTYLDIGVIAKKEQ